MNKSPNWQIEEMKKGIKNKASISNLTKGGR